MAKDADFDKVGLLLHCNGANGSTTFLDSSLSPKTATVSGAQIVTAQFKFGGASGEFVTGDYLTIPDSADFGFGTGDFTIEFWMRPTLTGDADNVILDFRASDSAVPLAIGCTTSGTIRYYDGVALRTGGTLVADTWVHVAWNRTSNVNNIYVGGTSVSTYTATQDFGTSKPLCIGTNIVKTAQRFNGCLDEIRISKGLGRYPSDFTPPAAPFPQLGDLSGLVEDASGDPAARLVRAMREDTGSFAGATVSDATTGAYMLSVNSEGAHTLVFYPADGEDLPALVLRGVVPV